MTGSDMALLLAIAGGAVVAVGVGVIGRFLEHRFARFERISREAAESRAFAIARIEEAVAQAGRARSLLEAWVITQQIEDRSRARIDDRQRQDRVRRNRSAIRAARARRGVL